MISYLKGKIQDKGTNYVILSVHDVGYKVFVNEVTHSELSLEKEVELYIYSHVKEDAFLLFGFYSMNQLDMFELLISINGVGPKSAMGVLAIAPIDEIKDTIARGDSSLLVKASGIGKKTAERMVLELRDKVSKMAGDSGEYSSEGTATVVSDEIDALVSLGYSLQQAREALRKVKPDVTDSGDRIKEALKLI